MNNTAPVALILAKTERFTPMSLKIENENHLMIHAGGYGAGSGYIHRIRQAIIGRPAFSIGGGGKFLPVDSRIYGRSFRARIGAHAWEIRPGTVICVTTKRIVYLLVEEVDTGRWFGLIDKTFDHVTVGVEYRTMRKHVRKGLADARVAGINLIHVAPNVLNMFKLKTEYNGKTGLYGSIVRRVRENRVALCDR